VASQAADKSEKGLASELRVSPYAIRDYSMALRQYPLPKIMDNISFLKDADLKSKGVNTGSGGDGQIIRELVWKLMH
jgi:DNA polymerase-3 subunit delta